VTVVAAIFGRYLISFHQPQRSFGFAVLHLEFGIEPASDQRRNDCASGTGMPASKNDSDFCLTRVVG